MITISPTGAVDAVMRTARRRCVSLVLPLTVLTACAPSGAGPATVGGADTAELNAILRAVELTYEVSSFADAAVADPEEFRAPFTPTATLSFTRDGELVERTVDEYVEVRREVIGSGDIQSLEEWELYGETVHFGDIAHRVSEYAVRVNGADEIAERGVMSFQLVRIAGEWKVHSLTWQAASADTVRDPGERPPLWRGPRR